MSFRIDVRLPSRSDHVVFLPAHVREPLAQDAMVPLQQVEVPPPVVLGDVGIQDEDKVHLLSQDLAVVHAKLGAGVGGGEGHGPHGEAEGGDHSAPEVDGGVHPHGTWGEPEGPHRVVDHLSLGGDGQGVVAGPLAPPPRLGQVLGGLPVPPVPVLPEHLLLRDVLVGACDAVPDPIHEPVGLIGFRVEFLPGHGPGGLRDRGRGLRRLRRRRCHDGWMAGWLDADAFCFSRQLGVECVFSRGDRDLSLKRIGRSE